MKLIRRVILLIILLMLIGAGTFVYRSYKATTELVKSISTGEGDTAVAIKSALDSVPDIVLPKSKIDLNKSTDELFAYLKNYAESSQLTPETLKNIDWKKHLDIIKPVKEFIKRSDAVEVLKNELEKISGNTDQEKDYRVYLNKVIEYMQKIQGESNN